MPREDIMLRGLVFAVVAVLNLSAGTILAETQFATPEEAKALLERAIAAVKEDKAKAFEMFATGDGGFKPKDLPDLTGIKAVVTGANSGRVVQLVMRFNW